MVSICKDPDVQHMDEAGSPGLGDCLDVGGDRGGKVKVDTHILARTTRCKDGHCLPGKNGIKSKLRAKKMSSVRTC